VHVERTRGDPLDGTHDCRPMVVFGTKCLSLTSTWIRSMPSRSTTAMSRPSAPKNGRRNLHGRPASGYGRCLIAQGVCALLRRTAYSRS
jgi:hypothetical protein